MRRLLPLLVALAVLATAVPAFADRPEPSVEALEVLPLPTACTVSVDIAIPRGGKRIAAVVTDTEQQTAEKFFNGTTVEVQTTVDPGIHTVDVTSFDPRGGQVYLTQVEVDCTLGATAPPAT
jgi:hypothetical protein